MSRERFGAGAELARRVEVLCATGILLRQSAWCLGDLSARDVHAVGTRVVHIVTGGRVRRWLWKQRQVRHVTKGHDTACFLLGVPERTLRRLIESWDSVGAAGLMFDAIDELMREAAHSIERNGAWNALEIAEAAQFSIRSRMTPANAVGPGVS
ncbi:MAG: hypothetical protein ACTHZ9_06485 [Leucobacter sp.]